jgi:hypothetical protein
MEPGPPPGESQRPAPVPVLDSPTAYSVAQVLRAHMRIPLDHGPTLPPLGALLGIEVGSGHR